MTKEDKVLVIQEIKDLLLDAKVVYVADLEGLNAAKSSDFRRQAFKNNIKVKVVKNTLLQKAMESMDVDFSEMFPSGSILKRWSEWRVPASISPVFS